MGKTSELLPTTERLTITYAITTSEKESAIEATKKRKATGPDEILTEFLFLAALHTAHPGLRTHV